MADATFRRKRDIRSAAAGATTTRPGQVRPIEPTDTLQPVSQLAADKFGQKSSPTTNWRWCRGIAGAKGKRRVTVLPAVLVNGKWMTSAETFLSWLQVRTAERLARSVVVDVDVGL